MWPFSNSAKLAKRIFEDAAYEQAAREIANERMRPGTLAKAYTEAQGDEQKAKALYVRLRAENIALEAKAQGEAQFIQGLQNRRLANAVKSEEKRLARAVQANAIEANRRRQIQETNRFWTRLYVVALMLGIPVGAGWILCESLTSLPIGVSYGVAILIFTTSWTWQNSARMFASNFRWTVVSGLLFFAVAGWALNVSIGTTVFRAGLGFMATVLIALSAVRRPSNHIRIYTLCKFSETWQQNRFAKSRRRRTRPTMNFGCARTGKDRKRTPAPGTPCG
jgi:hypothetical protein